LHELKGLDSEKVTVQPYSVIPAGAEWNVTEGSASGATEGSASGATEGSARGAGISSIGKGIPVSS